MEVPYGIVTPEAAGKLNLSTIRKESLYIPGYTGVVAGLTSHQNLPAADFAAQALGSAYETGQSTSGSVDYSGQSNLALYRLWQEYARTAPTSAKILNLIWTDLAANLVLGTRGLQPEAAANRKRDEASSSESKTPKVTTYHRRVNTGIRNGVTPFCACVDSTSRQHLPQFTSPSSAMRNHRRCVPSCSTPQPAGSSHRETHLADMHLPLATKAM